MYRNYSFEKSNFPKFKEYDIQNKINFCELCEFYIDFDEYEVDEEEAQYNACKRCGLGCIDYETSDTLTHFEKWREKDLKGAVEIREQIVRRLTELKKQYSIKNRHVRYNGKIKLIKTDSYIEFAGQYLLDHACYSIHHDDPLEQLLEDYGDRFIMIKGDLYKIIEFTDDSEPDHEYCKLNYNDDGTISFDTMFNNESTCFQEMIEFAIEKNTKKSK